MDTKELTRSLHRQWRIAKDDRSQRCAAAGMEDMAQKLHRCEMFKGTEDTAELAHLLLSPQGMEFCLAAHFPSLPTFRLFKPQEPERYGIYIDAGDITLTNPGKAVLIGKTTATVKCDTCELHDITSLYGAAVTVIASKWAVVHTQTGMNGTITRRANDNAIIL